MTEKNLTALCEDPEYIFADFENLRTCDQESFYLPGSGYEDAVSSCLDAYCENPDPELKGCPPGGVFNYTTHYITNLEPYPYFDSPDYCVLVNKHANVDIGGPGVS